MKCLFVGDSPTVSTGFSRCTRAMCDALTDAGHKVIVLGINESGDPRPTDIRYPIYPCIQRMDNGYDAFGVTRLPLLVARYKPDVVVLLNDPWNVKPYFDSLDEMLPKDFTLPPVIGWLAVDSKNHRGIPLNRLACAVTWTEFGLNTLRAGGYTGPSAVVPLGVDTGIYYPRDRAQCRRELISAQLPDNAFIVGVVGRNQYRKRLDLTLEYFAEWIHNWEIPNAYLFLHVAPTGDNTGIDVQSLVDYYKLNGRVLSSSPSIGVGVPEDQMAKLYNCFDVYLTTSQAEGWGLPCAEAMACGIPCIVPDFASFSRVGGWVEPGTALHVPCTGSALTAPFGTKMYTIGGVPDRHGVVWALNNLRSSEDFRARLSAAGRAHITQPRFQWGDVGREMVSVVEQVVSARTAPVPPLATPLQGPY
jgi:D-inositol-3-phosphate glycosyltransferase